MPDPTRLHRAYRARLDRLRATTLAAVMTLDTSAAAALTVLDAQRSAIRTTDAYLSLEAGLATDTSTAPWNIDPEPLIGRAARRGDFLESVYGRNWTAATFGTFAFRIAREVHTDLTLASRAATFVHTEGDRRIVGYRRVTSGSACALCAAASTRRYTKADLQPIHHGCSCTTAPIYGDADNWTKPNKAALTSLYRAAGGSDFRSLRTFHADGTTVDVIDDVLGPTLVAA